MKLNFYDSQLNPKAVVYHWISLLWQPKYNQIGTFQVELQEASDLFGLINAMDYVTYDADDTVMIVLSIQFQNKKLVISGFSAPYLLSKRVSTDVVKNENAEEAMRRQILNMTPWECVELGESAGITDKYTAQTSDGSVLDYCLNISQKTDIGFRIRRSERKLLFECYKPPLNTGIRFAANLGNMGDEKYTESENEYYNVAVVAGAVVGTERITVLAGATEAAGSDRREIYIDARDIQPEEGETTEEYEARLVRRGEKKLAEYQKVKSVGFSILAEPVSLGDKVLITPTYSKNVLEARVTSFTIKSQGNITQKTIGIGTPVPIQTIRR